MSRNSVRAKVEGILRDFGRPMSTSEIGDEMARRHPEVDYHSVIGTLAAAVKINNPVVEKVGWATYRMKQVNSPPVSAPPLGGNLPPLPSDEDPDARILIVAGRLEKWVKKDPKGFGEWFQKFNAWMINQRL